MTKIVGDARFTRFRRKLEDYVTFAINSGKKITFLSETWFSDSHKNCCCPLGCHPNSPVRAPTGITASNIYNIDNSDAWEFIYGFGNSSQFYKNPGNPYWELGQAYRERFLK